MGNATDIVKSRPAETTAAASALALLICYFAGIDDPAVLAALAVVIGVIPGIVTWVVVQRRKRSDGEPEAVGTTYMKPEPVAPVVHDPPLSAPAPEAKTAEANVEEHVEIETDSETKPLEEKPQTRPASRAKKRRTR